MKRNSRFAPRRRQGSITVLTAFMMVFMIGMSAFAIDMGYLQLARTELQSSADAAALAAANELFDDEALSGHPDLTDEITSARSLAVRYAALNTVCNAGPAVNSNAANTTNGDVVVGSLANPADQSSAMTFDNPARFNAVQVTVHKSASQNGEVGLFFGRVFSSNGFSIQATGTAAQFNNFGGFRLPSGADSGNLMMLPFALDKTTWDGLMAGTGTDNWNWDAGNSVVRSGADGIKEVNLYPQGTGSPGNRGTVDIGGSNNSTADISRQIVYGVNAADLAHFPNGELKFDAAGELLLNGDTGISAGVKDELASIKGQPRLIPIFSAVSGNGNNAQYTIVAFSSVRIVDVNLTGSPSNKRVMIQPCNFVTSGGIPTTSSSQSSYFVHSPVWLVR